MEQTVTIKRNEVMCRGVIASITIRETPTSFKYQGIRGHIEITKRDSRAVDYLMFLNELQVQFNPQHIYHSHNGIRFEVPKYMDVDQADMFLTCLDEADERLNAIIKEEEI